MPCGQNLRFNFTNNHSDQQKERVTRILTNLIRTYRDIVERMITFAATHSAEETLIMFIVITRQIMNTVTMLRVRYGVIINNITLPHGNQQEVDVDVTLVNRNMPG